MCCLLCYCFFLNNTATTGIYTYGHTLSLHDALPISGHLQRPVDAVHRAGDNPLAVYGITAGRSIEFHDWLLRRYGLRPAPRPACGGRSEEHTSELQSLMRISYAVFCLKKQKQNPN